MLIRASVAKARAALGETTLLDPGEEPQTKAEVKFERLTMTPLNEKSD